MLAAPQQITQLRSSNKNTSWERLGWLSAKGTQTMALLTAYLAHTARRRAGRAIVSAARTSFRQLHVFLHAVRQALAEAQELRRTLSARHPFIDT